MGLYDINMQENVITAVQDELVEFLLISSEDRTLSFKIVLVKTTSFFISYPWTFFIFERGYKIKYARISRKLSNALLTINSNNKKMIPIIFLKKCYLACYT